MCDIICHLCYHSVPLQPQSTTISLRCVPLRRQYRVLRSIRAVGDLHERRRNAVGDSDSLLDNDCSCHGNDSDYIAAVLNNC